MAIGGGAVSSSFLPFFFFFFEEAPSAPSPSPSASSFLSSSVTVEGALPVSAVFLAAAWAFFLA